MSDKNVPTGQWSKNLSAGAAPMLQKEHHHVSAQLPGEDGIVDTTPLSLTQSVKSSKHAENVTYAAARFQTPLIVNNNVTLSCVPLSSSSTPSKLSLASVASPSNMMVGGVAATASAPSITSNVPVSSAFLAPTFPTASAMLNINSYVAGQSSATISVQQKHQQQQHSPSSATATATILPHAAARFGIGQLHLQNLNAQQQHDLSKLMAATKFPTVHLPITCNSPNSAVSLITTSTFASTTLSTSTISSSSSTVRQQSQQPLKSQSQQQQQQHERHHDQQQQPQSPLGAIPSQIAEQLVQTISSSGNAGNNVNKKPPAIPLHGKLMGLGVRTLNDDKLKSIQQVVESAVGEHAKQEIVQILDRISNLRPVEKLLLYLRLPGEMPETDPLRQPQNPLGTRSEINHTINWVRTHLEQDAQVSIPKQDVYNDYLLYCERLNIKPLSTADFGKVMKQVFPGIRPRRLGTRGHSRYCYAAMRKTSKLPAPHLPTIQTNTNLLLEAEKNFMQEHNSNNKSNSNSNNQSNNNVADIEQYWPIIKQWSENILHVKIESVNDLANRLKQHEPNVTTTTTFVRATDMVSATAAATTTTTTNLTGASVTAIIQKHSQYRETKEKRLLVDLGPLKKRRKKKRKGSSSSSESGSNNQQQQQEQGPSPSRGSKYNHQQSSLSPPVQNIVIDDGQTVTKMIKIKQEIIDTPATYSQALIHQSSSVFPTILDQHQHQQQHQLFETKPMNLVSESRDAPIRIDTSRVIEGKQYEQQKVSSTSAFKYVQQFGNRQTTSPEIAKIVTGDGGGLGGTAAVKNLTPKITEMSTTNLAAASVPISAQIERESVNILPAQVTIKEEVVIDDYSTANVFCKKVLKAQQAKGFWINSPKSCSTLTSGNNALITSSAIAAVPSNTCMNLPIVTTTASTPPPSGGGVMTTPPPSNPAAVSNFSMGPPSSQLASFSTATIIASSSVSLNMSFNQLDDSISTPIAAHGKVLSKNFQQLRAKKLMAAATATSTTASTCDPSDLNVVKDTDLPENLGLPRERVISICNMDKHELDDYFLPAEEENSEDQETELLQYFQMGDAEEKTHCNKNFSSTNHNCANNDAKSITTTIANNNNDTINNGNPTVIMQKTTIATPNETITNIPLKINTMMTLNNSNSKSNNSITLELANTNINKNNNKNNATHRIIPTTITMKQAATLKSNNSNCSNMLQQRIVTYDGLNTQLSTSSSPSSSLPTVGTASASLIQLTQKHHQQQLQQQKEHPQECNKDYMTTTTTESTDSTTAVTTIITSTSSSLLTVSSALKCKVNVNASTATQDITAARKNYSFLPISPNINTTRTNSIASSLSTTLRGSLTFNNTGSFFASPNMAARTLIKQHSLDCDSSDPMIGSGRRKRCYFNITSASASAPPSPSILKQQQQQQNQYQQQQKLERKSLLIGPTSWITLSESMRNTNSNNNGLYSNANVTPPSIALNRNTTLSTSILNDQNSLDLDIFGETATATATTSTNRNTTPTLITNTCCNHALNVTGNDVFATLNEVTQRSQSVPLSQLQRSHSPTHFKKCFQMSTAMGMGMGPGPITCANSHSEVVANHLCRYSACASQSQTPTDVPTDFGDSTTILSENSCCSQQSATIKLEEVGGVVASDTTVILDEVDVSEILSSPDFIMKFSNLNKSNTGIPTCSSTGSSSGYSSAGGSNGNTNGNGTGNSGGVGNFTSTINNSNDGGGTNAGCGVIGGYSNLNGMMTTASRSVPSTPLPHHHHYNDHVHSTNTSHNCKRYDDRNYLTCNRRTLNNGNRFDCIIGMIENHHNHHRDIINDYDVFYDTVGSTCDISKSMPATPITTTPYNNSFRYSPTDITSDFLINGNTIEESINSSFNVGNASALCAANSCSDNDLLDSEHLIINSNVVGDVDKNKNDEFFNNDINRKHNSNTDSNSNCNFNNNLVTTFSARQTTINDGGSSLMNDSSIIADGMQPITSVDILDTL